jgi:hypothetical protein
MHTGRQGIVWVNVTGYGLCIFRCLQGLIQPTTEYIPCDFSNDFSRRIAVFLLEP